MSQDFPSDLEHHLGRDETTPVDFSFLRAQTFEDPLLAKEILELFVAQAERVLPLLPAMSSRDQGDTAHLLKGSARAIGAAHAARTAQDYEETAPDQRPALYPDVVAAFAAARDAIAGYLAPATASRNAR